MVISSCAPSDSQKDSLAVSGVRQDSDNLAINSDWHTASLKDVNSGQEFKVSDFRGKKVLVESFAVWCPVCKKQQENIKELHEEIGDEVISISLDTDPNEDEQIVSDHAKANGFNWRYAVAPKEMTQSLVNEFGIIVASAPSAPVILVCEDGSSRLMKRGIKSVEELKRELETGC